MKKSFKILSVILATSMIASSSPLIFAAPKNNDSYKYKKAFACGLIGAGITTLTIATGIEIYRNLKIKVQETPNEDIVKDGVAIINKEQDFKKIKNYKNKIVKVIVNVDHIPESAFDSFTELVEADLINVKTIGTCSFADCVKLKKVNAPKLTTIGSGAFMDCKMLEDFDVENVSEIGLYAFGGCTNFSFMDLVNAANANK